MYTEEKHINFTRWRTIEMSEKSRKSSLFKWFRRSKQSL